MYDSITSRSYLYDTYRLNRKCNNLYELTCAFLVVLCTCNAGHIQTVVQKIGIYNQRGQLETVCDERPKSPIEKRKRNLKLLSPISRGEGEIWNAFTQFWEEIEKFERRFSTFEKRKKKRYSFLKLQEEKEEVKKSPLSRRAEKLEMLFSSFEKSKRSLKTDSSLSRREWEKDNLFSSFKGEREFLNLILQMRRERDFS